MNESFDAHDRAFGNVEDHARVAGLVAFFQCHAREIALASNVSFSINASRLPVLPGALECIRAGHVPGGLKNNRDFAECMVEYDDDVPEETRALLYDPQTAGGLLMSVATHGTDWVSRFNEVGIPAVEIGEVHRLAKPRIHVTR